MCFRPDLVPNMNRFSVATSYVLVEGVKKRKKKKKSFYSSAVFSCLSILVFPSCHVSDN